MFEGFVDEAIPLGPVTLQVRHALNATRSDAPTFLLLHGHPRTSATWHRVAAALRELGHSVVCPDLRGYGRSSAPPTDAQHRPYSKRAMASDLTALADHLGLGPLTVVGHDRGAYVALRLTLDHPERVERLAVLDAVPLCDALDRTDARFATWWWHWFFFAQPDKPEQAILAGPEAWYGAGLELEARMGAEAYTEYLAAITDPATVTAMLEDYRAGLGVDYDDEAADRAAGTKLTCPVLALWAIHDDLADLYGDPLAIWARWADDLRGHEVNSGHHMAEDAPHELVETLTGFADQRPRGQVPTSADSADRRNVAAQKPARAAVNASAGLAHPSRLRGRPLRRSSIRARDA